MTAFNQLSMLWGKIPQTLKNPYLIAAILFTIWMGIFDKNNFLMQYRLESTLQELHDKQDFYQSEINQAKQDRKNLLTSDEGKEKFAREHYYMKKKNEEVFIIK